MINKVNIGDYKCLHDEHLEFKPLTIITGLNSTGKSSLMQSILFPIAMNGVNGRALLNQVMVLNFDAIRNRYLNSKEIKASYGVDDSEVVYNWVDGTVNISGLSLDIEHDLYYLSANRIGAEQHSQLSPYYKVGVNGEYLLGTFEVEKSKSLAAELIKEDSSYTLGAQVNYWMSYILGVLIELQTEKRLDNVVEVQYKSDGLSNLSPLQLGTGVSYLAKIVIMCLRASKGDVLLIENPEIHLHPGCQARVGEFLTFIANSGIQVIVETHCEHLIHRVGYEIYKKRFSNEQVTILYKGAVKEPFQVIDFEKNGNFSIDFPEGFFDATLAELLEME